MFEIFNNINELTNYMLKINNTNPHWVNNKKNCSIPISNKYFLTIFDLENPSIISWNQYINDVLREIPFPFVRSPDIDYSFVIESEQTLNIDIKKLTLSDISIQINTFFKIISDDISNLNCEVILVLDIGYLIENYIKSTENSIPNHLIEFIIWTMGIKKISHIFILDSNNIISNHSNIMYTQLKSCIKNYELTDKDIFDLDKKILVYKNIEDNTFENPYWNVLYPDMKISKFIQKIKSPFDDTSDFSVVIIKDVQCFLHKISLADILNKNLINLENNPGIIINPIDKLNITTK